jgi:hypothetical protein
LIRLVKYPGACKDLYVERQAPPGEYLSPGTDEIVRLLDAASWPAPIQPAGFALCSDSAEEMIDIRKCGDPEQLVIPTFKWGT